MEVEKDRERRMQKLTDDLNKKQFNLSSNHETVTRDTSANL